MTLAEPTSHLMLDFILMLWSFGKAGLFLYLLLNRGFEGTILKWGKKRNGYKIIYNSVLLFLCCSE